LREIVAEDFLGRLSLLFSVPSLGRPKKFIGDSETRVSVQEKARQTADLAEEVRDGTQMEPRQIK